MQASDKFRTDLTDALRRARRNDGTIKSADLRQFFDRNFTMVPTGTRDDLFVSFASRFDADHEKAVEWLGTIGSIFFMDYDKTPLSVQDWVELKEAVNLESGEFDLDMLEYVMSLVLDNGAL